MLSLVIPMYNEEKIITETIQTVYEYMKNTFNEIGYEVIFVNDGSKDNTFKVASEAIKSTKNIKVVSYDQNKGKGGAVRTGIFAAKGDYVFYTDCDLAYGLDVIKQGYDAFTDEKNKDFDIIIGSRRKHKDGYASYTFIRKLASAIFFFVLKVYGGIKQSDSQSGIKGFRKNTAEKIFGLCEINGWSFDFEILLISNRLKMKVFEMPVKIINHRESKINPVKDGIRMLKDITKIKKRVKKLKID